MPHCWDDAGDVQEGWADISGTQMRHNEFPIYYNTSTYYASIVLLCMGVKTSILHCKTKQSQSNNSLKLSKSELLDAVKKLERLGTCATIC